MSEPVRERRQVCLDVAQARGRLTSVVGAVFRPLRRGVGRGVRRRRRACTGQYRIGSITKTLTAVLVMQARDAGLLALDDPVGRHLGDVGYAEATIRELLSHTSGAQSEPVGPWWERSRGGDFAVAGGGQRRQRPGRAGGGVLPLLQPRLRAARRGARPADRPAVAHSSCTRCCSTPLGMAQTSYLPRPHAQPGWSVDHFTGIRTLEPLTNTGAMAPAGQLWSTVPDLVTVGPVPRRCATGPARPVDAARDVVAGDRRTTGSGCGSRPTPAGVLVGHTGSMPGFMASLFVDPGSGIGAAVLTNATTGVDTDQLAIDLIDGDFIDDVPDPWVPTVALPAGGRGRARAVVLGQHARSRLRWHNGGLDLLPLARFGDER